MHSEHAEGDMYKGTFAVYNNRILYYYTVIVEHAAQEAASARACRDGGVCKRQPDPSILTGHNGPNFDSTDNVEKE